MSKVRYYDFGVERAELERWAKEKGITVEQEIEWLKENNAEECGLPGRFEIIDDAESSPNGYEKEYKMRRAVKGRNCILMGVPIGYLQRQAKRHNMTLDQLMKEFKVVANYSNSREYFICRLRRWVDCNA